MAVKISGEEDMNTTKKLNDEEKKWKKKTAFSKNWNFCKILKPDGTFVERLNNCFSVLKKVLL